VAGRWDDESVGRSDFGKRFDAEQPAGVTAANLSTKIFNGRAIVDATAGFYNPTDAPTKVALGMGQGFISSIMGIKPLSASSPWATTS